MDSFPRQKIPGVVMRIQLNTWVSSLVRLLTSWKRLLTYFSTADANCTSSSGNLAFDRCMIYRTRDEKFDNL